MTETVVQCPRPSRQLLILKESALYVIGWALTFALLCVVLRLDRVDFNYPMALFAQGDGAYYCAQVKILLETGWVYHHPDLGAPFGLDLYDFAHFDAMHLLFMKLIGYVVSDWAVVLNLYYLLTFFLTTTTALALFRHSNFRAPLALVLALLFSFQPYHFERGQGHIMLAGYYHLPLLAFALLWLLHPLGLRDGEQISLWRSRRFRVAALFSFLGIFGGHYYAAFACMGYLAAAVYSSLRFRRWAPLLQAGLLFSIVGVGFGLNLLPNMLYWAREGSNRAVSAKPIHFVEVFSLRPVRMLLPVENHRIRRLANITAAYEANSPVHAEGSTPVGFVAGAGILALLGVGLFGATRNGDVLRGLGTVTLAVLLFTTMSGFGAIVAYVITPQFHGLNRVSIYLCLLGFVAVGLLVSRRLEVGRRPRLLSALVLVGGVLALLDILPAKRVYEPEVMNAQFLSGRRFAESIQEAVPPGTFIYQLPSSTFPFGTYEYLVPYLYTKGLRWSEPAMRNRRAAIMHETIEALPVERFLEQLALMDVGGMVIDVRGKPAPFAVAVRDYLLGPASLRPLDGEPGVCFFDLREYFAGVRSRYTDEQQENLRKITLFQVRWNSEFYPHEHGENDPDWHSWRWCGGQKGTLEMCNFHTRPMRVAFSLKLFGAEPNMGYTVSSDLFPDGPVYSGEGGLVARDIDLPPGRHRLTIAYRGKSPLMAGGRDLWFRVESFRATLVPDASGRASR